MTLAVRPATRKCDNALHVVRICTYSSNIVRKHETDLVDLARFPLALNIFMRGHVKVDTLSPNPKFS